MQTSYFDLEGKPPELVRRLMQNAFARPDASEPVSKGELNALLAMLMGGVVTLEKHTETSRSTQLAILTKLESRINSLSNGVAACERQLMAFHPTNLKDREPGTTSTIMHFEDGSSVTITRSFEAPGRQ